MTTPSGTLAMAGLVAAMTLGVTPARAYEGPWCAVVNLGFGTVQERCGMATFEMCRREAQTFGSTAFCRQNSRFLPYWGAGGDWRPPHRKGKRRPRAY